MKEIEERNLVKASQPIAAAVGQETPKVITANTESYYAILEQGDKALQKGDLNEAQSKYQQVITIQPDNEYAKKKLADVKAKRSSQEMTVRKELDDRIAVLKYNANKAFQLKKYDEALVAYNEAITLSPNDLFSKSQIETIKKIKADIELKEIKQREKQEQEEAEKKISATKAKADKALKEGRYDDAIATYTEALSYNFQDEISKNKIEETKKIKALVEENKEREKKNKDKDAAFKTIVSNADKAFEEKDYPAAKAGYLTAKDLKPGDLSVDKKLQLTGEKIFIKQKEEDYTSAVNAGDTALKEENFEKAEAEYKKASDMFKDRPYPLEKMVEINKIMSSIVAKQNEEKIKKEKELERINKYNSLITNADRALDNKDYANAKLIYKQSAALLPAEAYPQSKLSEIAIILENIDIQKKAKTDSLALLAEVTRKYNAALVKAKAAFNKKDYLASQAAYLSALELKPAEPEPKIKLEIIAKTLDAIALKAKYDKAINDGDSAVEQKDYVWALDKYNEAYNINSIDAAGKIKLAKYLISSDSSLQAEAQRKEEQRVQKEVRLKRYKAGMAEFAKYEKAALVANLEDELMYLKSFLNIATDTSGGKSSQLSQKTKEARIKIADIRNYFTRTRGGYQPDTIPYLDAELEEKYESINFTMPPEGQAFDNVERIKYEKNIAASKKFLSEKPVFSFSDSADFVKLTCVNIKFKNEEVFYIFQIQNMDSKEFLTGSMQLSVTRKNTEPLKINATYISSFPIIMPGKEFYVAYVTRDFEVNNKSIIFFDLNDRLKTKKLHISIAAKIYAQERKLRS